MLRIRRLVLVIVVAVMMILVLSLLTGSSSLASSNLIPAKHLALVTRAKLIADYTPAGCTGITLTNIIYCSGTALCKGTKQNDLMLGDTANNAIDGSNGDDCIVAGAGDDTVSGGKNANICIEGPGIDPYSKCTVVIP